MSISSDDESTYSHWSPLEEGVHWLAQYMRLPNNAGDHHRGHQGNDLPAFASPLVMELEMELVQVSTEARSGTHNGSISSVTSMTGRSSSSSGSATGTATRSTDGATLTSTEEVATILSEMREQARGTFRQIEVTLGAMRANLQMASIQEEGCEILARLARNDCLNREWIRQGGGEGAIRAAMQAHFQARRIQTIGQEVFDATIIQTSVRTLGILELLRLWTSEAWKLSAGGLNQLQRRQKQVDPEDSARPKPHSSTNGTGEMDDRVMQITSTNALVNLHIADRLGPGTLALLDRPHITRPKHFI